MIYGSIFSLRFDCGQWLNVSCFLVSNAPVAGSVVSFSQKTAVKIKYECPYSSVGRAVAF